jgi:hypothetical protein
LKGRNTHGKTARTRFSQLAGAQPLRLTHVLHRDIGLDGRSARFDAPDFVLFDTNTIPFALSAAKVNLAEAPQPGWGVTLWIDCDQVNALHAKVEAKGATILTPPYNGPFGRTFVFADPDGYRLTANENPWERFPLGGRKER